MSHRQSPSDPLPIATYISDGARIAAILLVWAILSGVVVFALGNLGRPGSVLPLVGSWLGYALGGAGVLNAILYVGYRLVDYWRA